MRRLLLVCAAIAALAVAAGCTHVRSATGGNTNMVNDAWFTQTTGLGPFLPFSTKVYYCPATSGGAATCTEAEMIEEASPGAGGTGPAPVPAPAPEPAPMPDEGMGGGEEGF